MNTMFANPYFLIAVVAYLGIGAGMVIAGPFRSKLQKAFQEIQPSKLVRAVTGRASLARWKLLLFGLIIVSGMVLLWPVFLPGVLKEQRTNQRTNKNALEEFTIATYGNPPPAKRANLKEAIDLACNELLMGKVEESEVRRHAEALNFGPIPYSTHDLALSVSLKFFKQPEYVPHLVEAQLAARVQALKWHDQGLVVAVLLRSFENVLYDLYKSHV